MFKFWNMATDRAQIREAIPEPPPTIRESEIEGYLVSQVVAQGGDTRKLTWIGRRGAPDRAVLLNGLHLVETKAPKGKLRGSQVREHNVLEKHGIRVWVINSKDQVDAFIAEILKTKKTREKTK